MFANSHCYVMVLASNAPEYNGSIMTLKNVYIVVHLKNIYSMKHMLVPLTKTNHYYGFFYSN